MTKNQRRALLAVIIGSGVVFLDGSVVTLALPSIASDLQTGFSGQQWVVDGYLLTLSALLLLGGSLGDIFGRKRIYLCGVVGFGLTSIFCAFAMTAEQLIVARILQGVCGALLVPGALEIIDTVFSANTRGRAVGLWTGATAALAALGPMVGGYVIDVSSWRWIFLINAPLLCITFWIGLTSIKEQPPEKKRHLDWTGAILATTALGAITYGLIEGPVRQWHWAYALVLTVGLLLLVIFVRFEQSQKDPMLPMRLFRSANFTGANITTFAMYGGLGAFFFMLPIYLQTTLHYSSLAAGLVTLPVGIFLTIFSGKFGEMAGRYGPRFFMTCGPIIAGIGVLMLLPLREGSHLAFDILPGIFLFGLGMSLTVAPLTSTVLASVHKKDIGIASGVNNAVSRASGMVVIAVLGLFSATNLYRSTVLLCAAMTICAGLLSFMLVRNPRTR